MLNFYLDDKNWLKSRYILIEDGCSLREEVRSRRTEVRDQKNGEGRLKTGDQVKKLIDIG
ncbi:MAG: hypothetical protein KAS51_05170 [Candidatus Omnitrophica bacterium]|nr:hypothetical protein [Candidatus Omnitrophota bacterium]